ncbi:membrane cofactor protein-like [Macrotis lagotis]|uniref:membrane cofactor protein-like n=1 Tax=Macrotis lagotis TaxID=92651 RepID=UPI003D683974
MVLELSFEGSGGFEKTGDLGKSDATALASAPLPQCPANGSGQGPTTHLVGVPAASALSIPAQLLTGHFGAGQRASQLGPVMSRLPQSASTALSSLSLQLLLQLLDLPLANGNQCPNPGNLSFAWLDRAYVTKTSFAPYSVVTYTCKSGYQNDLYFLPTRTCSLEGTWSWASEFCKKKTCNLFEDIKNGRINIKEGILLGATITFQCDMGFVLIGPTVSRCEVVNEFIVGWTKPFPKCEIMHCGPPPHIINGEYEESDTDDPYSYGSSVKYVCNKPYSLVGNELINCTTKNMKNGEWNGSPPVCKEIYCEEPVLPNGYLLVGEKRLSIYKEFVTFACNYGYYLEGEATVYCEENNKWVPDFPECLPGLTTANSTFTTTSPTPKRRKTCPTSTSGVTTASSTFTTTRSTTERRTWLTIASSTFTTTSSSTTRRKTCPTSISGPTSTSEVGHEKLSIYRYKNQIYIRYLIHHLLIAYNGELRRMDHIALIRASDF